MIKTYQVALLAVGLAALLSVAGYFVYRNRPRSNPNPGNGATVTALMKAVGDYAQAKGLTPKTSTYPEINNLPADTLGYYCERPHNIIYIGAPSLAVQAHEWVHAMLGATEDQADAFSKWLVEHREEYGL